MLTLTLFQLHLAQHPTLHHIPPRDGQGLVEAKNINKSLSSLADVFDALAKKQTFVPFRNSTLTFLLEMALSGNGVCTPLCARVCIAMCAPLCVPVCV